MSEPEMTLRPIRDKIYVFNSLDKMVEWDGTDNALQESKGVYVTRYEKPLFKKDPNNKWSVEALGELINMNPELEQS